MTEANATLSSIDFGRTFRQRWSRTARCLSLRCANELGFKRVKWIAAIEFVRDFAHHGVGHGRYNEGHEFYG